MIDKWIVIIYNYYGNIVKRRDTLSPDGSSLGKQHANISFFISNFSAKWVYINILTFSFYYKNKNRKEWLSIKPRKMGFKPKENTDMVNETLPNGQFLVIDENGQRLGTFDRKQALEIAREREYDILVVSPENSKPMVAKLLDYSKHRYDQQKRLKELKKNQQVVKLKEVKLSPTIDKHDFDTKLRNAQKFIDNGDKVKVSLRFRGRMITHKDIGFEQVNKFIDALENITIESKPKLEGMQIIGILAPSKKDERGK